MENISQLYQWGINVNSVATHKCTVNGLLLKHCRNDMLADYLKFDGENIITLDLYFYNAMIYKFVYIKSIK